MNGGTPDLSEYFESGGRLAEAVSGYEQRPGQSEMARLVMDALANEGTLVVEAPTGTGKTLAYLLPALLHDRRVVISTKTKNLQEQIFFKDWPLLRDRLGFKANIVVMKGRANYLCRYRLEKFNQQPRFLSKEEAGQFQKLHEWIITTETGDRAEVPWMPDDFPTWSEINSHPYVCPGRKCRHFDNCFLQRMRRNASMADLLIVNHHLYFADLAVKEAGPGEVIPEYHAVIFDEAHELEDIATAFFASRLSSYRMDELDQDMVRAFARIPGAGQEFNHIIKEIRGISDRFFEYFRREGDQKYRLRPEVVPPGAVMDLDLFCDRLGALAGLVKRRGPADDPEIAGLSARAEEILRDLTLIMDIEDEDYAHYVEIRGRGVHLVAEPVEPAGRIRDAVFSTANAVVFTSATLSTGANFKYFKSRLGLDFELEERILPTCFDYERQSFFYISPDMPDPNSPYFLDGFVNETEKILLATKGRALVLFTSIKNMRQAYERLEDKIPYHTMIQGVGANTALLETFRQDTHSVLFATASFWEGIDVVGEALSCVIIDKLPFSSPGDPLMEARIEALKRAGGNAFFDFQVPQAVISLKQGLGRLIRHKDDRGLLALFDSRLWRKSYGKRIIESLPSFPVSSKLEAALEYAGTLTGAGKALMV